MIAQETIHHARKIFALNFNNTCDKFLVFNQEICYSFACKMTNAIGPRLSHFSNAPTSSEVVNAELYLAMHSPYTFDEEGEDLFCYESMPAEVEVVVVVVETETAAVIATTTTTTTPTSP